MRTYVRFLTVFCFFVCLADVSHASISMTIVPAEGGSSLRFGRIDLQQDNDKEVTIRVTSTDGNQYQVFQRLASPLANEQGRNLNRSVLLVSGLTGSNAFGTLYLQGLDALGFVDMPVYTSDASGQSDSVTIFYKVDASQVNDSGNFFGNIIFTVRPVGGGSQEQVILKVYLESMGQMSVEARSSAGGDVITLKSPWAGMQGDFFSISLKDNYNGPVRIYQEVLEPLLNEVHQEIKAEDIQFWTSGSCDEVRYQTASPLERNRLLLCRNQKTEGNLTVNFQIASELENTAAGSYEGRVRYSVESSQGAQNFDVTLRIEILPVFKLLVEYPQGGMNFDRLIPNDPPQIREAEVTVKTNLGHAYVITQSMAIPLANEKGQELQKDFFTFRQELIDDQTGKIFAPDFVSVPVKSVPIFYSDAKGSPAQFKVIYRLRPFDEMVPGSYNTSITYSLEEK